MDNTESEVSDESEDTITFAGLCNICGAILSEIEVCFIYGEPFCGPCAEKGVLAREESKED